MSAIVRLARQPEPIPRHAPAEEYRAYVRAYTASPASRKQLLQQRGQFVRHYPDLREWFAAPLTKRVGHLPGEDGPESSWTCRACANARRYLLFLRLRGHAYLDWEWVLAVPRLSFGALLDPTNLDPGIDQLGNEAVALGYERASIRYALQWATRRIYLCAPITDIVGIRAEHIDALAEHLQRLHERPDVAVLFGSMERYRERRQRYTVWLQQLRVVLYHRGQLPEAPQRASGAARPRRLVTKPRLEAVVERYLATRRLSGEPSTIKQAGGALRRFIVWLAHAHPGVESFAELRREHLVEFQEALRTMTSARGQPFAPVTVHNWLSVLAVFFQDVAAWEWDDVPVRPLLLRGDLGRLPERVPRFIPGDELARLDAAVRALDDPYQRAALLIARYSGARRGEIRRLRLDCLDHYPDQECTPRLHIPTGKTKRERLVPLHPEAAAAIRELQAAHRGRRGLRDEKTGLETHYLFMRYGKLLSMTSLFAQGLRTACVAAGLLTPDGRPAVSAHRFRHTVGTQLGEKGASLGTIMKILGHTSPAMSLTYIHISDPTVLAEYQAVLGPGATIAGPLAETLRHGALPESAVEWLKANFLKTALELGHCLRLPEEGPCECDLYLTCAKFITTREYAPRLRRRRKLELDLAQDAAERGWAREVERHQGTARRIEALLADLSEPLDGPLATDS